MDHVYFGLSLLNRWIGGEENPWANADWNQSWQVTRVTEDQWKDLVRNLRQAANTWRAAAAKIQTWDDLSAAGTMASVAHTAYHMGAIRQILAMTGSR